MPKIFVTLIEKVNSLFRRTRRSEVAYCTKCTAIISEQPGFDTNDGTWTCMECGQFLYGSEIKNAGRKFKNVIWYCDSCNAILNNQKGFDDRLGIWECAECGNSNNISGDEIIEIEIDDKALKKIRDHDRT